VQYAKFRTDKEIEKGHSAELVSVDLPQRYYDNIEGQEPYRTGCETFLDYFEHNVKERPNDTFLGYRPKAPDGTFGPYNWITYQETQNTA
jgi:hypothetical protein